MSILVERTGRSFTIEDLERLSAEGERYELIRGELRPMAPTGGEHGSATKRFDHPLTGFIYEHDLGECFAAETGFIVARDPDTTMAPDWAFVVKERVPRPIPRKFVPVVPDMVLETRSPGDTEAEVQEKIAQWLQAGVRVALDLDPARKCLTLHRPGARPERLTTGDLLRVEELLPGFSVAVSRLLPPG